MFSNLDEQIETTQGASPTRAERLVRYLVVTLVTILVFGGIFVGLWLLEY